MAKMSCSKKNRKILGQGAPEQGWANLGYGPVVHPGLHMVPHSLEIFHADKLWANLSPDFNLFSYEKQLHSSH